MGRPRSFSKIWPERSISCSSAGTFCEQSADPSRAHNTCLIINPAGVVQAVYRKLHLFDVDLPGRLTYCESTWRPGSDVVISDVKLSTPVDMSAATDSAAASILTAPAICYDLRFPELFRRFADREVELITEPAAFTKATDAIIGNFCAVHQRWKTNVSSPPRIKPGDMRLSKRTGIRSIVDPWGEVLARAGEGEAVLRATLCANRISEVRHNSPHCDIGERSKNILLCHLPRTCVYPPGHLRLQFHARSECSRNCNCSRGEMLANFVDAELDNPCAADKIPSSRSTQVESVAANLAVFRITIGVRRIVGSMVGLAAAARAAVTGPPNNRRFMQSETLLGRRARTRPPSRQRRGRGI